jgi:uncharacterized alpha-E superfamily protein
LARRQQATLSRTAIQSVFDRGLHEYLEAFVVENAELDHAIAQQFRFS